ncbi:hypothetical protein [Nocardia sp. NBC_00403]|uniref:hypothetical protein n=1 Tax=Nocardia sp. NBC_00403 TaxID=2975990 RepID=UPI002E23B79D
MERYSGGIGPVLQRHSLVGPLTSVMSYQSMNALAAIRAKLPTARQQTRPNRLLRS